MHGLKRFALALIAACVLCAAAACPVWAETIEGQDYASAVTLNRSSETVKCEVTVKTFIDGDTTHFFVPESVHPSGVLKARYLAINTPETTNRVEEYGKKAAAFTREKLENAAAILIESDNAAWNCDSTGERYLVWVWYKPTADAEYRNLNIEILQNGLAIANSAAQNRYGSTCMAAIAQAKAQKLSVHSGQRDPDFFYGDAIELTLKELRCNAADYDGKKVAFTGIVTMNAGNSVYMEDFDPETGMYYGITVYYGYGLNGSGLDVLMVGNESRIVGTMQYYEQGGIYQVAGLNYRQMKPKDPGNIQKISGGHSPAFVLTDAGTFAHRMVDIVTEEGVHAFRYAALALHTSIEMRELTVLDAVTDDGDSSGAMMLLCLSGDIPIAVRLAPMHDAQGARMTGEQFIGKTIDVKGIVDFFDGEYQIKVLTGDGCAIRPE